MNKSLLVSIAVAGLSLAMDFSLAANVQADPKSVSTPPMTYGSQLMTPAERAEQRSKMCAAKTDEEREQIRKEHHDRMLERAKAKGVTLPEMPMNKKMGNWGMGKCGSR